MKRLTSLATLLLLGACVHTSAAVLDTRTQYAPLCVQAITVYTTRDRAPTDYQEVAILSSRGSSTYTNEQQMLASIKKEAAKVGATGIILNDITEASAGAKVAAAITGVGTERQGKALAIYSPSEAGKAKETCAIARMAAGSPDSATIMNAGTPEAACRAKDRAAYVQSEQTVTLHELADGDCKPVKTCKYTAADALADNQAIARCRAEAKRE